MASISFIPFASALNPRTLYYLRDEGRLEQLSRGVYRFSGEALTAGVETHEMSGASVRVYSSAKTVADGLKFRGKIGQDAAVEALMQTYLEALA